MHGKHKDTHVEFPVYQCQDCGRTGFSDILAEAYYGHPVCEGCGSSDVKELEDKS